MLAVIEDENLLQCGIEIGTQIDMKLQEMARHDSFECIGDVRALGCMNAVEFVTSRDTRAPDGELAARVVQKALEKGLILLTAGPARNVIRLLVPLTASSEIVEEGLNILHASLEEALA